QGPRVSVGVASHSTSAQAQEKAPGADREKAPEALSKEKALAAERNNSHGKHDRSVRRMGGRNLRGPAAALLPPAGAQAAGGLAQPRSHALPGRPDEPGHRSDADRPTAARLRV